MFKKFLFLVCFCAIIFTASLSLAAEKFTVTEINISAAISLKDALETIQKKYEQKNPDVKLIFNLNSSGALQTQIEQGAPADIFISAAEKQMDALEKKNLLVKDTRKNLLQNQLVMVILKNSALNIKDISDLTSPSVKKIAIGAPESVPAGQYAQQSLKNLKLWDKIQDKLVYGTNVRTVLTYVESGNAEAGFVYRTDSLISDKVKIVAVAPADSHDPVIYPAALLSGAKQPKKASDFLNYLFGSDSKPIFEQYGFVVLK